MLRLKKRQPPLDRVRLLTGASRPIHQDVADQLRAYGYMGEDADNNFLPIEPAHHSWGKWWMIQAAMTIEHLLKERDELREELVGLLEEAKATRLRIVRALDPAPPERDPA